MISSETIEKVKELNIVDVISQYIDLKKKGAAYSAKCPFHDEKSASFTVNVSKQYYKCFGCGAGGDSIQFVQNFSQLDFIGAVEEIAKNFSIKVEYTTDSNEKPVKQKDNLFAVNRAIASIYSINNQLESFKDYSIKRGWTIEEIDFWQIGFSKSDNQITTWANQNQYSSEVELLGLSLTKDEGKSFYDFFRNRVIFPVLDHRGQYVGFGGRIIDDSKPKYLNSKESDIYNKSKILYGFYQSIANFKGTGYAILVEGYTDVISMHSAGYNTTIATLGTSLTEQHTHLIKRFTSKVIIMRDGDKAGLKATNRDIKLLLATDIDVHVLELEDGIDPDDWAKTNQGASIEALTVDGLTFISKQLFTEDIIGKPRKSAAAIKTMTEYIEVIKDVALQEMLIIDICNEYENFDLSPDVFWKKIHQTISDKLKLEKTKAERKFNIIDEESGAVASRVPEDAIEEYYKYRFFERSCGNITGLWFPQPDSGEYIRLTNFILKPLFHLKSPEKNIRLVEAIGYDTRTNKNFSNLIELQSSEMLTKMQFATKMFDVAPYILDSKFTNLHLTKLNSKIAFEFRIANEITSLGWQDEGFWAFADKAWKDTLLDYDRFGIVEIGEANYLSPSASEMHRDEKDSVYENDKMHSYFPSIETFNSWSNQIMKVYGDNGYVLICFALMTVFVDIIKKYTEAPLWYPYGPKESGKSTLAKSLLALYFHYSFEPFNLGTASTDYAFFNRLERFNNCPAAFNEFDEFAIKEEWFRAFKAVYDGEGRERGRGIKGKTHTQKVKSSVVIIGQYLSTKDDNSVLSRTIPCLVKPKVFTQAEVESYDILRKMERKGLTSILIEIVQFRNYFEKEFKAKFDKTFSEMREVLNTKGIPFSGRILKNYATITAAASTLIGKLKFPFTENDLINYSLKRVEEISSTMSDSNALSDFWKTIEWLVDRNQIIEGWDFRIDVEIAVTRSKSRTEKEDIKFQEPTKVLYIRIPSVFREYARNVSSITKGKGLNEQTLLTYLKEQQYFIGNNNAKIFKKLELDGTSTHKNTSSMMLNYEMIGISIEKAFYEEDNRIAEEFKAIIKSNGSITPSGNQLEFRVEHTIQKKIEGSDTPKTEVLYTRCYITFNEKTKSDIKESTIIFLKGKITVNISNGRTYRNMDVEEYQVLEAYTLQPISTYKFHPEEKQNNSQPQINYDEPF